MEEKLAAYRAKKVKEAEFSWLSRLKQYFSFRQQPTITTNVDKNFTSPSHQMETRQPVQAQDGTEQTTSYNNQLRERRVTPETKNNDSSFSEHQDDLTVENQVASRTNESWWLLFFLKSMLWLCVWGIFIELEFGAVYFVLSLLIFIYFNTRTGQKDNKPSAYSVFNKDMERIQGTVTAEQLQRNMFRIPGMSS